MTITNDEYEILLGFGKLSPEMQKATLWLMENIDCISCLVEGEIIPPSKMKELQSQARKENNINFLALLIYKEAVDSKRYKTSISDKPKD